MRFVKGCLYQVKLDGCYEVYSLDRFGYKWLRDLTVGEMFVCLSPEERDKKYAMPRIRVLIGGIAGEYFLMFHPNLLDWPSNGTVPVNCSGEEEETNVC